MKMIWWKPIYIKLYNRVMSLFWQTAQSVNLWSMLFLTPLGGHNLKQTPVNVLFWHGLWCQECEIMKIFIRWKPLHPACFIWARETLSWMAEKCWGILSLTTDSGSVKKEKERSKRSAYKKTFIKVTTFRI